MSKIKIAFLWLKFTLEHYKNCEDENCDFSAAFHHFCLENHINIDKLSN